MASIIRSVHNPRVKRAIRLRDRRGRQQQSRIIVDGLRETRRALTTGIAGAEVFLCETMLQPHDLAPLLALLESLSIEPARITEEVFKKLAFGNRKDGVVLVAAEPSTGLDDLPVPDTALVGVLESVEKPGNLGAVLRSADAAGVSAIVVADGGTDLFNHNVIRASLGAVFRMPVAAAQAPNVLDWLRANKFRVFAARVDAVVRYSDVDYRGKTAVVLGNESQGLSAQWQADDITPIGLPMQGVVDSLNVSATAAVLFYEALRQRG